jgi:hypothetical protein
VLLYLPASVFPYASFVMTVWPLPVDERIDANVLSRFMAIIIIGSTHADLLIC